MKLLHKAQDWFLARTVRERVIVILFIAAIAAVWGSGTIGRIRGDISELSRTGALLKTQDTILAQKPLIDEQLSSLLQQMEPTKTLSATRLNAELANIGARLQLNPEIPPARTERVDRFLTHATEVIIRRSSYEKLVEFAGEIAGRSPYLNLEQIQIAADRSNPALLDARFRITAVELNNR
jgi:hypothetical protein